MNDAADISTTLLRNAPVQARSTARLTSLLDAAAAVVNERGYERLTTAMVAERAGSSIGTVYRYFPDRIAVLQALSGRFLANFASSGIERVQEAGTDAASTFASAVDELIGAFRAEPGFRSLRFGDVLDLRPHTDGRTSYAAVASAISTVLGSRYGIDDEDRLTRDVEVALLLADALLTRAFALDGAPDERFVDEAKSVSADYIARRYPG